MRKTFAAVATSAAILFSIGTGSAFADSTLNNVVESTYGTPYKFGGITTNGFDCSGFTRYVYSKMGVSLPRVSSQQFHQGVSVPKNQLKAGDLVFFKIKGNNVVSHVGAKRILSASTYAAHVQS